MTTGDFEPANEISVRKETRNQSLVHKADILGRAEASKNSHMRFSSPKTAATDPGRLHIISLKLREMSQLFNSMDPSPFIEKDLDDDAEEFIVSWAQEFSNFPLTLHSNCASIWTSGRLKTPKN